MCVARRDCRMHLVVGRSTVQDHSTRSRPCSTARLRSDRVAGLGKQLKAGKLTGSRSRCPSKNEPEDSCRRLLRGGMFETVTFRTVAPRQEAAHVTLRSY